MKLQHTTAVGLSVAALGVGAFVSPASAADSLTTVTPTNLAGFSDADTANNGQATLTATPPEPGAFGPGYLALSTGNDNADKASYLSYTENRPLADLTGVSYQVYRDSASTGAPLNRPTVQLPIYRNLTPTTTNFTTLIFEPLYCYSTLADDTWQTLDGDHQEPGMLGCYHTSAAADKYYKTLAEVQADFPDATLVGKGFGLGSYQPNTISRVDDLELRFTDGTATYDFEAADRTPPPPPLTALIDPTSVTEGNSGTRPATFTVTLNRASDTDTTVSYATRDGSAAAASDYVATTGTLVIPAGETSGTISVDVRGDTLVEGDEVFHVSIASTDADVSRGYDATATIRNDDTTTPPPGKPKISVSDASVTEGSSSTRPANFKVTLSARTSAKVTVRYATSNLTAKSGSDYTGRSGTLTIPAGSTSVTLPVQVRGDRTKEPKETFSVKLSAPSANAVLGDATGVGTILNDD